MPARHLPGSPGIGTKRVGQRAAVVYGADASNIRRSEAGGGCYKDCPGLGNQSVFYPYSSIVNTFTLPRGRCSSYESSNSSLLARITWRGNSVRRT